MSQNESKAGSVSASIQARLAILKFPELEPCSLLSPLSPEPSINLIPRSEWESYLSRTSKPGISVTELYGWFSGLETKWMNELFASIETPVQAVFAFQKINEKLCFSKGNAGSVSNALLPYYQKMLNGGIVELLTSVPELPKDIWSIMTQFLLWSLQCSSPARVQLIECLLRKIMLIPLVENSITNGSARYFTWQESNQRKRTKNMPAEANAVKSWTAQSYVKTQKAVSMTGRVSIDGTGSTITITKFKLPSAGDLESYAWEIAANDTGVRAKIYGYGFKNTLEEAAEAAYRSFYRAVTQVAFESALQFTAGKEIILLGNELTSEEFLKGAGKAKSYYFLVQMPQVDDRDGTLFCLNWHVIYKTKRIFKITKVNGKKLTLEGGTVIDVDTVLCYMKSPEQYVDTEVLCSKCGQLSPVSMTNGKYAHGKGYECGPCIDNSLEIGELSDGQFD